MDITYDSEIDDSERIDRTDVGNTLIANVSGSGRYRNRDQFQWQISDRDDDVSPDDIEGETNQTYTVQESDKGKYIYVKVTYQHGYVISESVHIR